MNKSWTIAIFLISFTLLAVLNARHVSTLQPFFKFQKTIKLKNFEVAKKNLNPKDQELLELWESMLTGRSAPLSKWMKERYQILGLNHLFTPSGFHLSAVLAPFLKIFKSPVAQWVLLALIGTCLWIFIQGQDALKRMVLIKSSQKFCGLKSGFILALITDTMFGSFQNSSLSFTYSFLFLGIIYSGAEGLGLIFWLFLGQTLIAYFQGHHISPLLLLLSPFLNLAFSLAMPLLLVLAIPLWGWQLKTGIALLQILQFFVDSSAWITSFIPTWQIHSGTLVLIICFVYRKKEWLLILGLFLSNGLNLDQKKTPGPGMYDFVPQGELVKIIQKKDDLYVYFSDGRCKRRLVQGMWWERCSPLKRKESARKRN